VRRLAAPLLALALLAGCSTRAERLYRRAETFLAQGQFQMAADEYRRLVGEHPRSSLADDALYKLAYILAEETGRPLAALVQYRRLADSYPSSPYADDALMRVMTIQRETLRDPEGVRATWDEMCDRFGDRKGLCARGMLEVARAHFEAEDYSAAAHVAEELTVKYSQQRRECSQAALLQARACERTGTEEGEIEALYEQVIEHYPDTHAAAMAKRRIGWIYFGKREEQQQQQAEELKRRSRIIANVPRHGTDEDGELMQGLAALRSALAHRGESRSLETLVALSGAAFALVFDPERPSLGRSALDRSPFESVAEALGFASNVWSGTNAHQAFESVHNAVLQGHPVLVLYGSPRTWVIVTGYDMAEERVHFMPPGRDGYASAGREGFLSNWAEASRSNSGVAGDEPFHQFSLGARMRRVEREELLRAVLRRAAEVMRATSIDDAPAGAAAWEAAAAFLEQCVQPDAQSLREQATRWAEETLRPHLACADMVQEIIQQAAQVAPEVGDAPMRYQELIEEARVVARKIDEATKVEEQPEAKWQAAAAQASYVAALHGRLAQQLAGACGT